MDNNNQGSRGSHDAQNLLSFSGEDGQYLHPPQFEHLLDVAAKDFEDGRGIGMGMDGTPPEMEGFEDDLGGDFEEMRPHLDEMMAGNRRSGRKRKRIEGDGTLEGAGDMRDIQGNAIVDPILAKKNSHVSACDPVEYQG